MKLLKPEGRLGYISSSTFFRTGSGENLRKFLGDGIAIEAVVDFGDLQLFEGVTTYPAIVALKKNGKAGNLTFLKLNELPTDLEVAFAENAKAMPRSRLTSATWQFEEDLLARLRDKISAGRKSLGDVYGLPMRGIVTGLNEAFVVDTATRDRLIAADPKSGKLLKPFLRGEDIKRWRVESQGLFLINTPKGKVSIDDFPAIRDLLLPFKLELEKRATKQEWFELQQAQLAYQPKFESSMITWPHFQLDRSFAFQVAGCYLNNKCFFISTEDRSLLSLLNSRVLWFQLSSLARLKRGGYIEAEAQYVEQLSLPELTRRERLRLSQLAEASSRDADVRLEIEQSVRRRVLDLVPKGVSRKLSGKLEKWWELDFNSFRAEVKRVFRAEIPVKERADWQSYLAEKGAEVKALTASIEAVEREIDAIVYRLFDLTPDEVKLLEDSLAGQY